MITMKDIAEKCNVSKGLVSRILNGDPTLRVSNETRTRVIEEVERVGYIRNFNAKALADIRNNAGSSKVRIGYVTFASKLNLGHPYFSHIVEGIMEAAGKSSCQLAMTVTTNELNSNLENYLQQFGDGQQLDGIILLGKIVYPHLRDTIKKIARYVVTMDGTFDKDSDFVGVNLNDSIQIAIEYMLRLGYQDIGLIYAEDKLSDWLEWCHYVMGRSGMSFHKDWLIDGEYTVNAAYNKVKAALKGRKPPRAFVAWNDEMALGCMKALTESGYTVPDDVAIVGHDDISIAAYTDVPLTTVRLYKKELGALAVNILLDRIESNRKIPIRVEIPGRLIKRDSCGRKLKKPEEKSIRSR